MLPQRELPELRELFVTPHRVDLGAVSAAAGVGHERVLRSEDLLPAVQRAARARGIRVVEVMIDPERGATATRGPRGGRVTLAERWRVMHAMGHARDRRPTASRAPG